MFKLTAPSTPSHTMPSNPHSDITGVDWGTTHRRAYAINAQGICMNEYSDADGAIACKGRFAGALDNALRQLQVDPGLVVMSGMVGSALGWHEVPYVGSEVALTDLAHHVRLVRDANGSADCVIVPGYCVRDAQGQPDVMRGEETQLLGAVAMGHGDGWFALPGTHSKWVELKAGRVIQLRTYMTGELFGLLSQHGTICAAADQSATQWSDAAFADGVQAGGLGGLSHQLFSCRARVVCADMPPSSTRSYLSGILIGAELHDVMMGAKNHSAADAFKLLCSPELATHYRAAASQMQLTCDVLDAKAAFIAAVNHIHSTWKHP